MGQHKVVNSVQSAAKKTVGAVNGSWIGGDSQAYQEAIEGQLAPAIQQLMDAIAGFSSNLGQGIDIMNSADQAVGKIGNGLNDVFKKII